MALPIRRATPQRPPLNKGNSRSFQPVAAVVVAGVRPNVIRAAQKSVARRAGNDLNSGLGPIIRGGSQWIQASKYNSGGLQPSLIRAAAQKPRTWRAVADTNQSVGPVTAVRGGSQWVQAPTPVVAVPDGDQPSVFLAVRPQPPMGQGRSRSYITSTATAVAGQRASIIRAAQKSVARRAGNDLNSGLGPIIRGGAQWIQAPQYNSGGLRPLVLAGRRQAIPLRTDSRALPYGYKTGRGSHWRPAPIYNSGGIVPTWVQGVKRPVPTRAVFRSQQWLQAAPYNSGGLVPIRSQALRQALPKRASSRLVLQPPSTVPVTPVVLRARRQVVPQRALSHRLPALLYNSGGLTPTRSQALRQALPKRASSRLVVPPLSTVPISPVVLRARRQVVPQRALSHRLSAPLYNAGGLVPSLVRGARRPAAKVRPTRLVVPPPLAAVIPDGDQPSVFSASRPALPPQRPASRWLQPVQLAQIGGAQPRLTRGAVRKPIFNRPSHLQAAQLYNAGGLIPVLVRGAVRKPILNGRSRSVVAAQSLTTSVATLLRGAVRKPAKIGAPHSFRPAYNGSGIAPQLSQGIRRHPGPVGPSRWRPAPGYNAGGLVPQRTRGVPRKPGPVKPSHQLVAQPYNSGGLKPLFRAGLRQRPPTRGRSHSWLAPIAETATTLRYYLQDQEPARSLSSSESIAALLDQEPIKGLTSTEPPASLTDNEPNQSPGTGVKGQ